MALKNMWLNVLMSFFLYTHYSNANPATVSGRVHFQQFYSQIRPFMLQYLAGNCSSVYQRYLHDPLFHSDNVLECDRCAAAPVVQCLLSNFPEVDKSNMASAAVLLGIVPATLSLAGFSTAETGLLSIRRPLLAFLIAAGAPAISPIQTFKYGHPRDHLQERRRIPDSEGQKPVLSALILILEYLMVSTAIGNLAHVGYQLCIRTVCNFSIETVYLPALWAFLALTM